MAVKTAWGTLAEHRMAEVRPISKDQIGSEVRFKDQGIFASLTCIIVVTRVKWSEQLTKSESMRCTKTPREEKDQKIGRYFG